jgi:multiple sugar transport system substrate-binding protein
MSRAPAGRGQETLGTGGVRPAVVGRRVVLGGLTGTGAWWLAACGGGPAGGGGAGGTPAPGAVPAATNRYLSDNAGPRGDVFAKTVIPAFTGRYPQITVHNEPIAFGELLTRITAEAAAGTLADVVRGNQRWHRTLIPQRVPLALDDRLKTSAVSMKDMSPAVLRPWADPAGKVFGIPDEIAIYATCYAVPLFQQRGLKPPAAGWTKDDLLAVARELAAPEEWRWGWYDLPTAGSPLMEAWLAANGGRILSEDLSTSVINSPQNVEVLEFWASLRHRHRVTPMPDERKIADWNEGRVAMRWIGPGDIANIKRDTQVDTALSELPAFRQKGNAISGGGVFVGAQSKAPDAAFAFLAHLVSPESQLVVARENGWLPSFTPTLARYLETATPPPASPRAFLDGLAYAVAPSLVLVPGKFSQLNDPFVQLLDRIWLQNEPVKPILDELKTLQDRVLKEPA